MAYTQQSFTTNQILTATQMNKVETNILEHQHGVGNVNPYFGPIYVNSIYIGDRLRASNTSIGVAALGPSVTGSGNMAIGFYACASVSTGYGNTGIGFYALSKCSSGYVNLSIGTYAGAGITNAYRSSYVGFESGRYNNGIGNTAIGYNAFRVNSSESLQSVAIGSQAMENVNLATQNLDAVAIGYEAMNTINGGGYASIAIGYRALYTNSGGISNIAIGMSTLSANVGGDANIAIGTHALESNTNGENNIAIGQYAQQFSTVGSFNLSIGRYAQYNNITAHGNIAIGPYSLYSNSYSNLNLAIGRNALYSAVGSMDSNNVVIGHYVADSITTGINNTAIGQYALSGTTIGSLNTAVGYNALVAIANSYSNCTGLGANTAVTGNNQVQLGDSATTTYAYGAVQNRSDRRDKADIEVTSLGLYFISKLNPVQFRWDYREDYEWKEKDGSKKRKRLHQGLIAQDVATLCGSLGVDFAGLQHHEIAGGQDVYSIGYDELITPLIKAVQELTKRVETLESMLGEP